MAPGKRTLENGWTTLITGWIGLWVEWETGWTEWVIGWVTWAIGWEAWVIGWDNLWVALSLLVALLVDLVVLADTDPMVVQAEDQRVGRIVVVAVELRSSPVDQMLTTIRTQDTYHEEPINRLSVAEIHCSLIILAS